jgi:hypothetical protein
LFAFVLLKLGIVITKYNPDVSVFDEVGEHQTEDDSITFDDAEVGF